VVLIFGVVAHVLDLMVPEAIRKKLEPMNYNLKEPDCNKKFAMAIRLTAAVSVANLQNSVYYFMKQ